MTQVPVPPTETPKGPSFTRRRIASIDSREISPSKLKPSPTPWLTIPVDTTVQLFPIDSSCMILLNTLGGNSPFHLVVADSLREPSLKVLDGARKLADAPLNVSPVAIEPIWKDKEENVPSIALAVGDKIMLYHSHKFSQTIELDPVQFQEHEIRLWDKLFDLLNSGRDQIPSVISEMKELREAGIHHFSYRIHQLLAQEPHAIVDFLEALRGQPYSMTSTITALSTIKKRQVVDGVSPSLIAVGTMECLVLLLNPPKYEIIERFQLSSPVIQLQSKGSYFGDFQIYALCRDNCVYVLSKNQCKVMVQSHSTPIKILSLPNITLLACVDRTITSYKDGQKSFRIRLPCSILQLERFVYPAKKMDGFMVALENKEVRIYDDLLKLKLILTLNDRVAGFKFGSFKGEEGALVSVLQNGRLQINILKRSAPLDSFEKESSTDEFVAKKSRAYVDCLKRERQKAPEMFNRYLIQNLRERVTAGRLELEQKYPPGLVQACMITSFKLHVEIQGRKAPYNLCIQVENISKAPVMHVALQLSSESDQWRLSRQHIQLPFLPPSLPFRCEILLESLNTQSKNAHPVKIICRFLSRDQYQTMATETIYLNM